MSYSQCYIKKGSKYDTIWIPSRYAKVGSTIDISGYRGHTSTGWKILHVIMTLSYYDIPSMYSVREVIEK